MSCTIPPAVAGWFHTKKTTTELSRRQVQLHTTTWELWLRPPHLGAIGWPISSRVIDWQSTTNQLRGMPGQDEALKTELLLLCRSKGLQGSYAGASYSPSN